LLFSASPAAGAGTRGAGLDSALSGGENQCSINPMPLLVWIILCGIWGSTWLFIKLGLEDLPPLTFAGIRFVIAALVLMAVALARRLPMPDGKSLRLLALTGFLSFTMNYGLLFWGEQHISSGLAALLQATIPLFGLVLAHVYIPAERVTPSKTAGVLMGLAGVALIVSEQMNAGGHRAVQGSIAIVVGALAVALANVLVKARGLHLDPAMLALGQMVFGLVPLLFFGVLLEGNPVHFHWTGMAVVSLLYLALVGSSVAFILYYWLVRHMAVFNTMLISLVTPVVAIIIGGIVLGEKVPWRVAAGGAVVLSGIAVSVVPALRRRGRTRVNSIKQIT
jgi:drug/metabolite transporter (DMT)-like permease